MKPLKSNLGRNLATALFISASFLISCQDSSTSSNSSGGDTAHVGGTDTAQTGLEGTRDQSASLSTDAKADTSSGQSAAGTKQKDSTPKASTMKK